MGILVIKNLIEYNNIDLIFIIYVGIITIFELFGFSRFAKFMFGEKFIYGQSLYIENDPYWGVRAQPYKLN